MYISQFHAKILDDGCLYFRDNDDHTKEYFISPWEEALKAWVIDPKKFNYRKTTYQNLRDITLLTVPHLKKSDHPVKNFVKQIPDEIIKVSKEFLYLQFHILRTVAYCSYAYDLLLANPNLLALKLLTVKNFENWLRNSCVDELSMSQRDVLSEICSRRVTNGEVNVLKKIKFYNGDKRELSLVYMFLKDYSNKRKQLSHMAIIPVNFIEAINDNPLFIISPYYIKLSHTPLPNLAFNYYFIRSCYLQNNLQAMQFPDKPDICEALSRIKNLEQLKRLNDRIVDDFNIYRNRPESNNKFIPPPLPGIPGVIEPIVDSYQLHSESNIQNNCVASMVTDYHNYFYRVIQPDDRCTLHIHFNLFDKEYIIRELKGVNNCPAKPSSIDVVQDWLDKSQLNTSAIDQAEILYNDAVTFLLDCKKISASSLQQRFCLGYNRAEHILKLMEKRGFISCIKSDEHRRYIFNLSSNAPISLESGKCSD